MKPPPIRVLVLHPRDELHRRIAEAVGADAMASLPDWPALRGAVMEAPPSALVVADPFAGATSSTGFELAPAFRELLADFPSVPVFAAVALDVDPEPVRLLSRYGVSHVISLDHDDTPEALRLRFEAARGGTVRRLLEELLPPNTSSRARAIVDTAAGVVASGGQGLALATELGVSRRTLLRWCEESGLPAPKQLLAWMRVLLAAAMLDDAGRTVSGAARACGYASDGALRRAATRFAGASPTQMRRRGAFALASKAFLARLREAAGAPEPAPPRERRRNGEGA